jgi:hypothetical protein
MTVLQNKGRDSAVGIATGYVLDGQGIETRWGRDFPHTSRRPWGPPSFLYNGYRVFAGVKRPGRGVDHPPPSSDESKEIVFLRLALEACSRVNCMPQNKLQTVFKKTTVRKIVFVQHAT